MRRRQFIHLTSSAALAAAATGLIAGVPGGSGSPSSPGKAIDTKTFHAMRQFAETSFGKIAYVERGSGPDALFLHGFPLNGFQWRGALERLAHYRHCVAPDWLGLGYTEVAEGQNITPADQVAMLRAFMDKLSIQKVDLIANDSGGAIAQLFLTRYPERVRTLLLTNCDVEPDSPPPKVVPLIEAARAGRFADETFRPQLADKNLARSATGLIGLCYAHPGRVTDETIDCYFSPLISSPRRVALANAYAIGLDPNPLAGIEPALRRSPIPTRIVWGMADEFFSADSPGYLASLFPRSQGVRRLPQAKTFFPEEFPDVIAQEARRLWHG